MDIAPLDVLTFQNETKKANKFKKLPTLRGIHEIKELLDIIAPYGHVIGGYARWVCSPVKYPEPAQDCDIYCNDEASFHALQAILDKQFIQDRSSKFSILYGQRKNTKGRGVESWAINPQLPAINLIKPLIEGNAVLTGTVEDILNNFDFTVTRAAIIDTNTCLVDEDFVQDEVNKKLVLKNIHCPVGTSLRIIKYTNKGYKIGAYDILPVFLDWETRPVDYKRDLISNVQQIGIVTELMDATEKTKKTVDYKAKLAALPSSLQRSVLKGDTDAVGLALGSFYEKMSVD